MPVLVALDLDGTLLDSHGQLPSGHVLAVRRLRRLGHQVAIVTGRPLLTARWVHAALDLALPMVCFNGCLLGMPDAAPLHLRTLPAAVVQRVRSALSGLPCSLCVYPDARRWLMDRVVAQTAGWEQRYGCRIELNPTAIAAWDQPTIKIMVVADPLLIADLVLRLRGVLGGLCEVVASQDDRIEIMPAGVTKAHGLSLLAQHIGVAQRDVWAVGDADNDVEMVAWAGHGCVMGYGTPRLRAVARHVLPSASERGLCALQLLRE